METGFLKVTGYVNHGGRQVRKKTLVVGENITRDEARNLVRKGKAEWTQSGPDSADSTESDTSSGTKVPSKSDPETKKSTAASDKKNSTKKTSPAGSAPAGDTAIDTPPTGDAQQGVEGDYDLDGKDE